MQVDCKHDWSDTEQTMKTLIADDSFTGRLFLHELLKHFGVAHIAVNGKDAVKKASTALDAGEPYDLICLDITMPEMDGHEALRKIRALESKSTHRSIIVMTTASASVENVVAAQTYGCDAYLTKPILKPKLMEVMQGFGLIK